MDNICKKIKYASSRDEVIYALEDAGFTSSVPIGILIKEERNKRNWANLDLLYTAKLKLESLSR